MAALIQLLFTPLMLFNFFGGIIAGIWLAVLGECGTIGIGIVALIGSSFLLSIALMPQLLIGLPAIWLIGRGHKAVAYFFGVLSNVYLYAVVVAWSGFVIWYYMSRLTNPSAFIPTLIWSYGTAIGPWTHMASHEIRAGTGEGAAITTLFVELGYIVMMAMLLFGSPRLLDLVFALVAVSALGVVTSITVMGVQLRQERV